MHTNKPSVPAVWVIYTALVLAACISYVWSFRISAIVAVALLHLAGLFVLQKILERFVPLALDAKARATTVMLLGIVGAIALAAALALVSFGEQIGSAAFALAITIYCLQSWLRIRREGA